MARVASAHKVARSNAILAARAAMKGAGPTHTASTKSAGHAKAGAVYVKRLKLRKIRLRGSKPSSY